METNGNPWNLSRMDRAAWSDGLDVPTMSDKPDGGGSLLGRLRGELRRPREEDRARDGEAPQAGGCRLRDPRAGRELHGRPRAARGQRVSLRDARRGERGDANGYKEQGGAKTVVTACPHCFNTLKNEYPDFGAKLEVVHHTDFLLGLLAEGKLVPKNPVAGRVVYHDSCYLGRYNGVYESPREILKRIPGVELVEPEYWTKQRGLCCGAGGAQMLMEEQNQDRVNVKRTLQLVDTGAKTIASACPFCMTMLTDGVKSKSLEDSQAARRRRAPRARVRARRGARRRARAGPPARARGSARSARGHG